MCLPKTSSRTLHFVYSGRPLVGTLQNPAIELILLNDRTPTDVSITFRQQHGNTRFISWHVFTKKIQEISPRPVVSFRQMKMEGMFLQLPWLHLMRGCGYVHNSAELA